MKSLSILVFLLLAAFGRPLHAQNLDLTKGLGKFTWGMQFADAVQLANATYGPNNVHPETTHPSRRPVNSPIMPNSFRTRMPAMPAARPELLGGQVSSVAVAQDNLTLELQFFHGRLFQISKALTLPIKGYLTPHELDAAKLAERAKSQITVGDGIDLSTNFEPLDEDSVNNAAVYATGIISFTATNNRVFNEELSNLRANNPNPADVFLKPLLTP